MKPDRVEQLMSRVVATCRPDDRLNAAARIMWERDCGVVPVTMPDGDAERVVGMLTDRDVCMAAYTQGRPLEELVVSSAMSRTVHACAPGDSLPAALERMAAARVRRLPVVDGAGRLVGLLSFADVAHEDARRHKVVKPRDFVRTVEAITAPRAHDLVAGE